MTLTIENVAPKAADFVPFASRRSVVHSSEGIVACTQPLAARCGLRILAQGGNAADAAVAVAAGLNMTEPSSTGIGGDMFCIYYDAKTKKVSSINGSGRSPAKCTLETVRKDLALKDGQYGTIPFTHVDSVTVPGAAAGWVDTVERLGSGKLTMEQILAPAIELGEKGFPVHELAALFNGEQLLRDASPNFKEMLKADPKAADGFRAPASGELMYNKSLASTFRTLATDGKEGFYTGRIAEELVKVCKDLGGHIELDDLKHHLEVGSEDTEPISIRFSGQGNADAAVDVWEHPPNGQGIVALMALGILEELEKQGKIPTFTAADHNTAPYIHAIVEALRIAFADANWFVSDPNVVKVPVADMLSPAYLAARARLFDPAKASPHLSHGSPAHNHCDTVYFSVADAAGNAISFINSNYAGFGSAIIPRGCGFTLQNRGANFSLVPGHPNAQAPRKRPYHTIIPALVTRAADRSLHCVYGVMGGFMQPQGHVQVLLNMLGATRMNAQAALDAPRVCISAGVPDNDGVVDRVVALEEGIGEDVARELAAMGHQVQIVTGFERGLFGRGQVICKNEEDGKVVYSAGSDLRGDGAAYPAWTL